MRLFISLISITFLFIQGKAQEQTQRIKIVGKVFDAKKSSQFNKLMVINRKTQSGVFGNLDGTFTISINRSDTISVHALGYAPSRICFKDSSLTKNTFEVNVMLYSLNINLSEIVFVAPRDLNEIQKDIEKLGYQKRYKETPEVADMMLSPITALYERFSRFEKQKQEAKRLQNESNRRKVLKELFQIYVTAEIIELEDWEFDDFVSYCNFDDEFIKNATQYELVMAVKRKFERYVEVRKF